MEQLGKRKQIKLTPASIKKKNTLFWTLNRFKSGKKIRTYATKF